MKTKEKTGTRGKVRKGIRRAYEDLALSLVFDPDTLYGKTAIENVALTRELFRGNVTGIFAGRC